MKVAMIKSDKFVCDEYSAGVTAVKKLSCQIFLAASYCRNIGIETDVFNLKFLQKYEVKKYDIVVSWVPLYEGFYEGIDYLKEAKKMEK